MNFELFQRAERGRFVCRLAVAAAMCWLIPARPALAQAPPPPAIATSPVLLDDFFGDGDDSFEAEPAAGDDMSPDEMLVTEEGEQPDDQAPKDPAKQQAAQLLAQYLAIKPQARQPASVLQALAAQSRAKAAETNSNKPVHPAAGPANQQRAELHKFVQGIAVGDWLSIKKHLADMPPELGAPIYNHLLELLNHPEQPAILLPGEILPLADASPKELTPQQLAALGALLKNSLRFTAQPQDLLARLKAGTDRLGGSQPKRRLAAARLLLAAGLLDEAGTFAPSLEEALHESAGEMLNVLGDLQQARAARSHDPADFARAWDLTQAILVQPDLSAGSRYLAVARALRLISIAPPKGGDQWLRDLFEQRPDLGMFVLAQLGGNGKSPAVNVTIGNDNPLRLQQRVIAQLLATVGEDTSPWTTALDMLTAGWIEQAERALGNAPAPNNRASNQRLANLIRQYGAARARQIQQQQRANAGSNQGAGAMLPPADVLAASPNDAWLKVINPDLARKVRQLEGMLAAHVGDQPRVFAAIDAALPADVEIASQFAEHFLQSWANSLGTTDGGNYSRRRYGNSGGESVSLTRARQVRNLTEYADLLAKLKSRALPPIKPEILAQVFAACHSPAEVYRDGDMQQVFGPPAEWPAELAVAIVTQMRDKLAGQWRNPQLQDQAGTHRTDKEQVAEMVRGYELAERLLDAAAGKSAVTPELELLRAVVYFDQSEFAYGQQVPLADYTKLRDRAFAAYRHAAELYAASLKKLPVEKRSVEVYQAWFQAALGASDLAFLLPNHKTDLDQIGLVRQALMNLPADLQQGHLAIFGESLNDAVGSVPPQLKPHYYREVVRVLDDHPSAEPARQKLAFYGELLDEVRLHLVLDGSADVGHDEPFGVHLTIRSTDTMTRESDNFQPLLQSLQTMQAMNRFQQNDDVRKKLEAEIKDKLGKTFTIKAMRFHEPTVKPRRFGREGWLETPLGYLLLEPKDPSVDRVPPLQLDMTFSDGSGEVLLPITTQVVLVNAGAAAAPAAPLAEVKVKQLLDDRQLGRSLVRLEVSASAKGLLGKLEQVLDMDSHVPPGFSIKDVRDQGVEVVALDASGEKVAPISERTWVVDFEPLADAAAAEFAFPPARDDAAQLTFEHYADADLVECANVVPLHRSLLPGSRQLWVLAGAAGAIALAAGLAGLFYRARKRRGKQAVAIAYRYPAHVTPFNLLLLLKRIQEDASQRLAASERASLSQTVSELERRHFAPQTQHANGEDLQSILDRWLSRVGAIRTVPR